MCSFEHQPVLLTETIEGLITTENGVYVDCTLGGAGHSETILREYPEARIIGIDRDSEAIAASKQRLAPYGERAVFVWDNFANINNILAGLGIDKVDGFLFDLGVSSPQLDHGERGFSYMQDAPLDMRMDRERGSVTAADIVNTYSLEELTDIIYKYGEERWSKRIAEFITAARAKEPLTTTGQLVSVIKAAVPKGARTEGHHPAKKTFQALRIAVNDELNIISGALTAASEHLKTGGRIAVISFHSLEDRIVKDTFKYLNRDCICPPEQIVCTCGKKRTVKIITRKPVTGREEELKANPRARSAKLRIAERI